MGQVADEVVAPDLVVMRHRSCGAMVLAIHGPVIDNPRRAVMARDCFLMTGDEPKAGAPSRCPVCGERYSLTPRDLDVDRGPDNRQSLLQRAALKVASAILAGKAA
jgi:hypothetical protein